MHRIWMWIHPLQFLTVLYIFLGVLAFGIHFVLLSTERYNWFAGPATKTFTVKKAEVNVPTPKIAFTTIKIG
jgi:light-harvesting complex 1 alpha chain